MRKFLVLLMSLMLIFMLVACGTTEDPVVAPPDDDPVDDPGDDGPVYGGTVRLALTDVPPGVWNPAFSTAIVDNNVIGRTYTFLGRENVMGEFDPLAAEEWWFSEDQRTLTFKIRDDIFFHDGVQLTAHDVEFSFLVLADPDYAGPRSNYVNFLEGYAPYRAGETDVFTGIEVINDFEIAFTSVELNAKMLRNLAFMGILPKHILGDVPVADMPNHPYNGAPINAGPFRFVEHARDQYIILEANEDYFEGRPYIDEIIYLIRTPEVALMEMETGNVDLLGIPPEQLELVEEWDHVIVEQAVSHHNTLLAFNMLDPRFDQKTRQAMTHAINRQGILDDVFFGVGAIQDTPIAPISWGHNDAIGIYEYNPEKARQMLADAGWAPGPDGILARNGEKLHIELLTIVNVTYERIISIIQQDLEAVGLKVDLMLVDFPLWIGERFIGRPKPYTAEQFDMTMIGLGLGSDPDMYPLGHSLGGFNLAVWYDDHSDALLEAGLATVDTDERREIYLEWQEYFFDQIPVINLRATASITGYTTRLRNVEVDWRGAVAGIQWWWIPKELQ